MPTIESRLAALYGQALGLQAQIRAVEAQINQRILAIQADPSREGELSIQGNSLQDQRQNLRAQLARVNQQIAQLQQDQAGQTSSGAIVRDDSVARVENANQTNPGPGPSILQDGRIVQQPDTQSGTNADQPVTKRDTDSGLNEPVKTLVETQSTPVGSENQGQGLTFRVPDTQSVNEDAFIGGNYTGLPLYTPPQPGGDPGVGAAGDDRGGVTTNATVTALNSINYTDNIVPQENILDQYSSYTYQASLYLCTKQQYQTMVASGQKTVSGAQLIVQSGGASVSDNSRNSNFPLDYFIDRLELKSLFPGKATRLAHNVSEVKMTIVEPAGITFLDNLDAAVQQFAPGPGATTNVAAATNPTTNSAAKPGAKKKNFTAQIYLLAIRFYGYDQQGNLVKAGKKAGVTTDPAAVVEKWYPLVMTNFDFKVSSKLVEYNLKFTAPPYYAGGSAAKATIPFNIELSGGTVKDILAGPVIYGAGQNGVSLDPQAAAAARAEFAANDPRRVDGGSAAPPPKASSANTAKSTVRQGLMAALNAHQRQLVSEGIYQYPDEYDIEFALDVLGSATITSPGTNSVAKGNTSMAVPTTAGEAKLGAKQSMDPNSRVEGATAGTQIVQFIDTLLRNSSYIKDQQLLVIDENTGKEKATGVQVKNVSWYKIGFRAEAKMDQYDEKRNDYAYKITYVVSPYKISQLNSPYFNPPKFNGVHKQYRYWFTGENTQVLSYEESLNSLYYVVMSGANFSGITSNANELLKASYQTASGQATQGAEAKTLEPAANAADQLYNPGDLKTCNMTIVGDPAWLQQGEVFVGLRKGDPYYYSAFLADGTINVDSQQVLFEIGYNTAKDYDLTTGLMDVRRSGAATTNVPNQGLRVPGAVTQTSRVYIATECISEFNKGKFTQNLKGSLMVYYPTRTQQPTTTAQTELPRAADQGAKAQTSAPAWTKPTSVTSQTPTSQTAIGVQQILRPTTNGPDLTNTQLRTTPIYIQARKNGSTDAVALAAARSASAAGTNNYQGVALPGIRDSSGTNPAQGTLQKVVKDGNPG